MNIPSAYKVPVTNGPGKKTTGKKGIKLLRQALPLRGKTVNKVHPEEFSETLILNDRSEPGDALRVESLGRSETAEVEGLTRVGKMPEGIAPLQAKSTVTQNQRMRNFLASQLGSRDNQNDWGLLSCEAGALFGALDTDIGSGCRNSMEIADFSGSTDNSSKPPNPSRRSKGFRGSRGRRRHSFLPKESEVQAALIPLFDKSGNMLHRQDSAEDHTQLLVEEERRWLQHDAR
jgi:hypothetical protein